LLASQLLLLLLPLLGKSSSYPLYVLVSTGRGFAENVDPLYQPIETLSVIEEPAKVYAPNDLFGDVHKFVVGVQSFVENPPNSLYSALNQLQTNTKKNDKKPKQKPLGQRVVFDPFGSGSFSLGWSVKFQVSNSFGIS
ncbi:hypothetical protein KR018_003001, partial [Drosophila ironensis]